MLQGLHISRGAESILQRLQRGEFKNIVVLTGAGISCAAGIPDFRSPGGMYDTLRPELLTATERERHWMSQDPTAVVDFDLFRINQFPYLELRRPFIIGSGERKWKATLSHFFLQVLLEKRLLRRLYTQNIDGLDYQVDIPKETIVNVHGTIAEAKCEFCGFEHDYQSFVKDIKHNIKNIYDPNDPTSPSESRHVCCSKCQRPGVKPATVLFGRNLPPKVFKCLESDFPSHVDLMLIIGTSLQVYPACNFVTRVRPEVPRLLLNLDLVGANVGLDFGAPNSSDHQPIPRDGCILGPCDHGLLYLAEQLGWVEELKRLQSRMSPSSAQLLESWHEHTVG